MGVEALTERDHFVCFRASNTEELKRMYELVRPQISVPVHGEHVHMHEYCLARSRGVPKAFEMIMVLYLSLPGIT